MVVRLAVPAAHAASTTSSSPSHARHRCAIGAGRAGPYAAENVADIKQEFKFRGAVNDGDRRCVSLRHLRHVGDFVRRRCRSWFDTSVALDKVPLTMETLTMYQLNEWLIKPATTGSCCAFSELLSNHPDPARWFVAHHWTDLFSKLLACLEKHAVIRGLHEDSPYWMFIFATRDHNLDDEIVAEPWDLVLRKMLHRSNGALVVLSQEEELNGPNKRIFAALEEAANVPPPLPSSCLPDVQHLPYPDWKPQITPPPLLERRRASAREFERSRRLDPLLLDLAGCEASDQPWVRGVSWGSSVADEQVWIARIITTGLTWDEEQRNISSPAEGYAMRDRREADGMPLQYLQAALKFHFKQDASETKWRDVLDGDQCEQLLDPVDQEVEKSLRAMLALAAWRMASRRGLVEEWGLTDILAEHKNRRVIDLDLSGCATVSDDALVQLAGVLPTRLTHLALNLWRCPQITDAGLAVVLKKLPDTLLSLCLRLDSCECIGSVSFLELSRRLPAGSVESFELSFLDGTRLPSACIAPIMDSLPKSILALCINSSARQWTLSTEVEEVPLNEEFLKLVESPQLPANAVRLVTATLHWEQLSVFDYAIRVQACVKRGGEEILEWQFMDHNCFDNSAARPPTAGTVLMSLRGSLTGNDPFVARMRMGDVLTLSISAIKHSAGPRTDGGYQPLRMAAPPIRIKDFRCVVAFDMAPVQEPSQCKESSVAIGSPSAAPLLQMFRSGVSRTEFDLRSHARACLPGPRDFEAFLDCFRRDRVVLVLKLPDNDLSSQDGVLLADALRDNRTLRDLVLDNNQLGAEGAAAIAEALQTNSYVKRLSINCNTLLPEGMRAFANLLRRDDCSLEEFSADKNCLGAQGARSAQEALKWNQSLQRLSLSNNNLGNAGSRSLAEGLRQNSSLRSLCLEHNNVTSDGARSFADAISANRTLTDLSLAHNGIASKDDGAQSLAKALSRNPVLERLNLEGNLIDVAAGPALADALARGCAISELNLSSNFLRADGMVQLALGLHQNHSLREIRVAGNKMGDEGVQALAKALWDHKTATALYLKGNSLGPASGPVLADLLRHNHVLRLLDLDCNYLGSPGAVAVAGALQEEGSLEVLNLSNNDVGVEGVRALAVRLYENASLTDLSLAKNNIGAEGASYLDQALQVNYKLKVLNLDSNSLGSRGGQALSKAIRTNTSLTDLSLAANDIEVSGASAIFYALPHNQHLQALSLDGNRFGSMIAPALQAAFQFQIYLKKLSMSHCDLGSDGAIAMATALKSDHSLVSLGLSGNAISCEGGCALAAALRGNRSLKALQLRNNALGQRAADDFLTNLKENSVLEDIQGLEEGHKMSSETASSMAQALLVRRCSVLETRSAALARRLPCHLTFLELNFSWLPEVCDRDVSILAGSVPQGLRNFKVALEGSEGVTKKGTSDLGCSLVVLPSLTTFALSLACCPRVDDEALLGVVTGLPPSLQHCNLNSSGSAVSAEKRQLRLPSAYQWRREERARNCVSSIAGLVQRLKLDAELVKAESRLLDVESKAPDYLSGRDQRPWMPPGCTSQGGGGDETMAAGVPIGTGGYVSASRMGCIYNGYSSNSSEGACSPSHMSPAASARGRGGRGRGRGTYTVAGYPSPARPPSRASSTPCGGSSSHGRHGYNGARAGVPPGGASGGYPQQPASPPAAGARRPASAGSCRSAGSYRSGGYAGNSPPAVYYSGPMAGHVSRPPAQAGYPVPAPPPRRPSSASSTKSHRRPPPRHYAGSVR
eukprot:TRINITY_DN80433_c0_g1_i1.p1 TRINITY_DN80433_c0_g1~~TRINITY_DN80433_c0_g1_i1.p1  ORF type:complete len:1757 (-),score=301.40 TRINITY_DN80433_c0_g1_i1:550-5820(-)